MTVDKSVKTMMKIEMFYFSRVVLIEAHRSRPVEFFRDPILGSFQVLSNASLVEGQIISDDDFRQFLTNLGQVFLALLDQTSGFVDLLSSRVVNARKCPLDLALRTGRVLPGPTRL